MTFESKRQIREDRDLYKKHYMDAEQRVMQANDRAETREHEWHETIANIIIVLGLVDQYEEIRDGQWAILTSLFLDDIDAQIDSMKQDAAYARLNPQKED